MSILTDLRRAAVSRVLEPDDSGFDAAVAGFDLGIPIAPDAVVDAQTPADVASTVAIASEHGVPLAVLGSGHGRLAPLDGGLALTVRALDAVDIDPTARTATIGAGCTWVPVVAAAAQHGLAAPCGSAPSVGVAGYLLGGGLGPLASSIGFSSDHVRSFDLVTPADGAITVSADSHPDLFWAMRGGKGGFGVVTAVTIDLLPIPEVFGGGIYYDGADALTILRAYATWASSLPGTATASIALLRLPAAPGLPPQIRGRHVVHLRFASLEEPSTAAGRLQPMRGAATPLLDNVGVLPYAQVGAIHNDPTAPMPVVNGTASLHRLDSDAVDALLDAAGPDTDLPLSSVEIRTLGPATHPESDDQDAVSGRSAAHILNAYAAPGPSLSDQDRIEAVRTALNSTIPWQGRAAQINFVGRANLPDSVLKCWTAEQRVRLEAVRRRHDPDVRFPFLPEPGRTDPGA